MNSSVSTNRWFIWTIVLIVIVGGLTWAFIEYVTIEIDQNILAISYSQTRVRLSWEISKVCNGMSLVEAESIAIASECGDSLAKNYFCNTNTRTWWLDLTLEKENCAPACVIDTMTKEAEINWRCTGLSLE